MLIWFLIIIDIKRSASESSVLLEAVEVSVNVVIIVSILNILSRFCIFEFEGFVQARSIFRFLELIFGFFEPSSSGKNVFLFLFVRAFDNLGDLHLIEMIFDTLRKVFVLKK